MQPTKSQAISNLLHLKTHKDLASLYNLNMECQVNVAKDNGDSVEYDEKSKNIFSGRKGRTWTDGQTIWKNFRIPWKAYSEPEFNDTEIKFDLAEHAESIGLTGWDWYNQVSCWVGFDFDSITTHKDGLTVKDLTSIKKLAEEIPWITVRKSTSGTGLHLYVFVDSIPTKNHSEHAALSRAILGKMSAHVGYNFESKIDVCGQILWVWSRRMCNNGLELIKQGEILHDIPKNWKDHISVITGSRRRNLPQNIDDVDNFDNLTRQRPRIQLDESHKQLIEYLTEEKALWWWDQDNYMLVTHTSNLKNAHTALSLLGIFETSGGTNLNEQNCFAFPMRDGVWSVRRYSQGCAEHESWIQDSAGWTQCFLNKLPDLKTASRTFGGIENAKGGFIFYMASDACKAAEALGVYLDIDTSLHGREAVLSEHKDGRLVCEVTRQTSDKPAQMSGWYATGTKPWYKIFNQKLTQHTVNELDNLDDLVRHLVTIDGQDYGWILYSQDKWRFEPLTNIKLSLQSMSLNTREVNNVLGASVLAAWTVVNKPFEDEYPGNREWNISKTQFKIKPSSPDTELIFPTWMKILEHCGSGLDNEILRNPWCKLNNIKTGSDYLMCWLASMFQEPYEPLPYLFMYGPQNSGKSIFHEAVARLLRGGVMDASSAITSGGSFNAELEGSVLCVLEETDLNRNKDAYNRIKNWVTSPTMLIHEKGRTPYTVRNTTHYIHDSNDHKAVPLFPGDTRITMCYVGKLTLTQMIPKKKMWPLLDKEASNFLAALLNLEIPESDDRLHIPVINTQDKKHTEQSNMSPLETFIADHCVAEDGYKILFSEFFGKFIRDIDQSELDKWSKNKVGRNIPPNFPKAVSTQDASIWIGNIRWHDDKSVKVGKFFVNEANRLVSEDA